MGRLKQTMGRYDEAQEHYTKGMQIRESGKSIDAWQ